RVPIRLGHLLQARLEAAHLHQQIARERAADHGRCERETLLGVLGVPRLHQRDALQTYARLLIAAQGLLCRLRQPADPVHRTVPVLALVESLQPRAPGCERRGIVTVPLRFERLERRTLVEDGIKLRIELLARTIAENAADLLAVLIEDDVGRIAADLPFLR